MKSKTEISEYFDMRFNTLTRLVDLQEQRDLFPPRYGTWHLSSSGTHAIPKYLSGSDYSGSLVEVSNRNVWRETFSDGEGVFWEEIAGGHGTFAIVVLISALPDEAIEFLEGLSTYPLADEDDHSRLEMEAQSEEWSRPYGTKRDFLLAIEKTHGLEEGTLTDAALDGPAVFELFSEIAERINENWVNEQGSSVYIRAEKIGAAVTTEELADLLKARTVETVEA